MKLASLVIVFISLLNGILVAQEKYPIRQITFKPDEAGFFDWSPDGNVIVFSKPTGLWKFLIDEGIPMQIIATQAQHPDWSPDGQYIVFDADSGRAINITSSNGGVPVRIVPETIPIIKSGYPLWSPEGTEILFQAESLILYLLEVQTGKYTKVTEFDKLIPVPKSWSPDGEEFLISLRDQRKREANFWLVSREGERKQLTFDGDKGYGNGDFSPGGELIVYSLYKDHKVWIMPSKGGRAIQLTFTENARDSDPKFSSDGKKIAFNREISGITNLWILELSLTEIKKELDLLNLQ